VTERIRFPFDRRAANRYSPGPLKAGLRPEETPLPDAKWGTKHLCESCGAKFYDMKKTPATCPSCDTTVEVEIKRKTRTPAPAAKKAPVVAKVPEDDPLAEDEAEEEVEKEEEEELLPDDDEEDDGLDDVAVVKPKGDEDEET